MSARAREADPRPSGPNGPAHAARGSWWEHLRHGAEALLAEAEKARKEGRPIRVERLHDWLGRARWLADSRPRGWERVRQWWTQADVLEGLSAVHAADEELAGVRPRSDLLVRVPVLRADLTRLLGEDDPRRRDLLRLLDRFADVGIEQMTAAVEGLREEDDEHQRGFAEGDDEPGGDELPWKK